MGLFSESMDEFCIVVAKFAQALIIALERSPTLRCQKPIELLFLIAGSVFFDDDAASQMFQEICLEVLEFQFSILSLVVICIDVLPLFTILLMGAHFLHKLRHVSLGSLLHLRAKYLGITCKFLISITNRLISIKTLLKFAKILLCNFVVRTYFLDHLLLNLYFSSHDCCTCSNKLLKLTSSSHDLGSLIL